MDIHSKEIIREYFLLEKEIREYIKHRNNFGSRESIYVKIPNLSSDATESLAAIMIKEGLLPKNMFKGDIISVKKGGRKKGGRDIIINDKFHVEVKGTSSGDGFTTISKSNLTASAWMWFDLQSYFKGSNIITVHVIRHPSECVDVKHIAANKENKTNIRKVIPRAEEMGFHDVIHIDMRTFGLRPESKHFQDI